MSAPATFEHFERELNRLVEQFGKHLAAYKGAKLLGLMPKLRAVTSDSEKATLQNAVTATDHQIDALVHDLYGLTPEEIQLVEGAA